MLALLPTPWEAPGIPTLRRMGLVARLVPADIVTPDELAEFLLVVS